MNEFVKRSEDTTDATTLDALLRHRYGAPPTEQAHAADLPMSDFIESLLGHRSVRAYSDRALPDDILQTIIAAAQSASSSSNLQAWSVVAVRDNARKERLAACAGNQKHVSTAPLLLVFIADLYRFA